MSTAGLAAPARVGERFSRTVKLTAEGIHEFAQAAGDMNPLHHDAMFAEASRFGGIIASGTHYVALIMGLVATHFTAQGEAAAGLEFSFQLKKPVRAGDTITLTWEVMEVTPKASLKGDILTLNGRITTQTGAEVLTCVGKIVLFYPS
ncbi:MAG: maoC like domain protein [Betaproteobacteria bacterium]|nr:maoC like domain protein [Betaproteobacteria bacterium]